MNDEPELNGETPKLFEKSIEEVMHEAMMPYAEFIIMDRALPRVEDGLKPVQRRILYAMNELANTPDKPYKKCARIVGECLGKYHPHGDTSVYDALVRLAQSFNMGQVLVDGQGNYGSVDGDGAAAMRYTEARLAPLALELLRDIDKETVSFSPNFDDTLKEPDMLPGRYPNLLVNGASGIAIGLATNIPTHNLGEVIDATIAYIQAKINKKTLSLDELMSYVPAPDFPTGGELILDEIKQAYETGRGKITMRAKFNIEREGEKRNIVFTEFPYQVNKQDVLKKLAENKENKKEEYWDILDVVDESDRNGIRAVVKLRKDADIAAIVKMLFKQTDLSKSYNFNMVAIAGGKPKLMGLADIISYYADYQRQVIKKRSVFDLARAKDAEEILSGLMIAINNIDEVIRIIKKAGSTSDAKSTLRVRFDLSDKQANAILEMRLKRLTALEVNDLKSQIAEIRKQIAFLTEIVQSEKRQMEVVCEELAAIKRKYKQPRKSHICKDAELCFTEMADLKNKTAAGVLLLRNNGTVSFVTNRSLSASNRDISAFDSDTSVCEVIPCNNDMLMYAFTDKGNYLRLYIDELKECKLRDVGFSAKKLCKEAADDEKIIKVIPISEGEEEQHVLAHFVSDGLVRLCSLSEFAGSRTVFGQAIKFKSDQQAVVAVEEYCDKPILLVSRKGNAVRVDGSTLLVKGRLTLGAGCIKLDDDDALLFGGFTDDLTEVVYVSTEARAKKVYSQDIPVMDKMRKGVSVMRGLCCAQRVKDGDYLVLSLDTDETKIVDVKEIFLSDIYDRGDYIVNSFGARPVAVAVHRLED